MYVRPSLDSTHDSANPGTVEKSSADLLVRLAYCRFHTSNSGTRYPTVTFGDDMSWSSPIVIVTGSSWAVADGPGTETRARPAIAPTPSRRFIFIIESPEKDEGRTSAVVGGESLTPQSGKRKP